MFPVEKDSRVSGTQSHYGRHGSVDIRLCTQLGLVDCPPVGRSVDQLVGRVVCGCFRGGVRWFVSRASSLGPEGRRARLAISCRPAVAVRGGPAGKMEVGRTYGNG